MFTNEEIDAIIDSVKMKNTENEYHLGKYELMYPNHAELADHKVYQKRLLKRAIYRSILNKAYEAIAISVINSSL